MTRAFVGLGSNIGDRLGNLRSALRMLSEIPEVRVVTVSSIYETDPVGPEDQPDFLNAVIEIDTTFDVRQLFDVVKHIETEAGRKPTYKWGPREIDLDLLLYGDHTVDDEDLEIPHPRMTERAFVVVPLAEIAPDLAAHHLAALDTTGVRRVGIL